MRRTLDSVLAQTVPPDLWVVVDDGSTDETPAILAEFCAKHPNLRVVRRDDRGRRSVGPGVIEAFYAGLETVDLAGFDFLCKLDMDLDVPPRYFEILLARMAADPRLGTCSGKPYHDVDGRLVHEVCGDETSVGMTKFYRRECFQEIGGFVRAVMWDGIDCHRCRMSGWIARSWDEPDLRFLHLRTMGSSEGNLWEGRKRHGRGQHFMGTGLAYMTASALFRMTQTPYVLGGLAMWLGWVGRALRREERYGDAEFRRFLRRWQRESLLLGKRRATARCDARQEPVFRRLHPGVGGSSTPRPAS
ncbi:MAG: glycosyltransferase family 2 protein [Planctomycetes bacterium]|nr:glycosyltransferase family 2 protein [Planctomycetota bacterium]